MQNKININNYEAFLLDYSEGRLAADDVLLLKAFAASHPELEIDLNDTELAYVEVESSSFLSKESLKKTNADLVPDELLIGYVENILSEKEKLHVELSCESNTTLAKELKLYKNTVLVADKTITFENKNSLKKQTRVIEFTPFVFRMAAAVLLITVLGIILYSLVGSSDKGQKLASLSSEPKNKTQNNSDPENSLKDYNSVKQNMPGAENLADLSSGINTSKKSASLTSAPGKEKSLLANTIKENISSPERNNSPVLKKDEILPAIADSVTKNALAANQPERKNTYVVLEEVEDDEDLSDKKEKKGFWVAARRALSSLNKLGVKKVNGTEAVNTTSETYVLSLGNFSIEKNKYNAE